MTQKVLGMITIPAVGGSVTVSSTGVLAIKLDGSPHAVSVELDEAAATKIADGLVAFVVVNMVAKKADTQPPGPGVAKASHEAR